MKFLNEEINLKLWIIVVIVFFSMTAGMIFDMYCCRIDDGTINLSYRRTVEELRVVKQALIKQEYWDDNDLKIKDYLANTVIEAGIQDECDLYPHMDIVEYPYDLIIDANTVVFEDYKIVYEELGNVVQVIVYSDYNNYKVGGKGGTLIMKTYFELIE